jgi:hypothetical protein
MAEKGTPRSARAQDPAGDELLRDELQRRLDHARDSISQTVSGIKDNAAHRYKSVKENVSERLETLDWREQFRERPATWTLGAIGVGFITGYMIAAVLDAGSDDDDREDQQHDSAPVTPQIRKLEKAAHRGLFKRFQETEAYHRIETEGSALGNRLIDEAAQTAKEVLLPAAIRLIRGWLERAVSNQQSARKNQADR